MNPTRKLTVSIAMWLAALCAVEGATLYTDETAFLSAAISPSLESFEGLPATNAFGGDLQSVVVGDFSMSNDGAQRICRFRMKPSSGWTRPLGSNTSYGSRNLEEGLPPSQ